jgi:hypothetical protein
MASADKPLVWLHGEVKTPPFSAAARLEVGVLLRRLQRGERVSTPRQVLEVCQRRLRAYDQAAREEE